MYRRHVKSKLDKLLSFVSLLLLSPLFIIIGIAIKKDSKGPIFFTQERVGLRGEKFRIVKFRTMLTFEESYYADGTQIENYDRITKVGNLLRKTSLDELPQLINIFKGDMSLVGPRPTLSYQVENYDSFQMKRLEVKPGLTGLAQVSGRNSLTWEDKINYDLQYVNKLWFITDVIIILRTFLVLFRTEKVSFSKHDKISEHKGDVTKDVNL